MSYTLIVSEKPSAAKRIANVIGNRVQTKTKNEGVWYETEVDGRDVVIAPAAGHLFNLKQKGKGWSYPVFDVEWMPSYKVQESSKFSQKFFDNLQHLAENADDFIIATDYDQEGDVIGYNILRFICGQKDASRMKFSTLTRDELINAYEKASKHLDMNQIEAGLARHYLDWYWGINTTRALTTAVKSHGERFRILSAGRVQGPLLNILSKREHKIMEFEPEPFWELEAQLKISGKTITAEHTHKKFWKEGKVKKALENSKGEEAEVTKIKKRKRKKKPPTPFDTTTMLRTINRYFGYTPKKALSIAEGLYQKGLISYPRTSSQKLPKKLGYNKILKNISRQRKYKKLAQKLLNQKTLKPRQGKRKDKAHPAVYPTGEVPKGISSSQKKVYDLIVHRFLAVFGKPALRESLRVNFDIGGEQYKTNGIRTLKKNWFELYGKYAKFKEQKLPDMEKGDIFDVKKVNKLDKETQPPKRYTQNSALKQMQKLSLGTKATRANILQTLYDRNYITGKSITVTKLGLSVADVLSKHCKDIVSEQMTRDFEEKTENISNGKEQRKKVLKKARKVLTKIMEQFKDEEKDIGIELGEAVKKTREKKSILGTCPNCGGQLKKLYSRRTKKRFVGCSSYPECKTGFPLPQDGLIVKTDKTCDKCSTPIIEVARKGKRPFRMCLDPECETKEEWLDKEKLKKVKKESKRKAEEAKKRKENGHKCEECDRVFDTKRGLSIHKSRMHKDSKD